MDQCLTRSGSVDVAGFRATVIFPTSLATIQDSQSLSRLTEPSKHFGFHLATNRDTLEDACDDASLNWPLFQLASKEGIRCKIREPIHVEVFREFVFVPKLSLSPCEFCSRWPRRRTQAHPVHEYLFPDQHFQDRIHLSNPRALRCFASNPSVRDVSLLQSTGPKLHRCNKVRTFPQRRIKRHARLSLKKATCGDGTAALAGPDRLRPLEIPAGRCAWTELHNFAGPQSPRKSSGRQEVLRPQLAAREPGNTF